MSVNTHLQRRGLMFVLSSPSGAGKTTLSRELLANETHISLSVSVTTREKRASEIDGKDYHFISREDYSDMVNQNQLLEHAEVFGNFYGTPRNYVEQELTRGEDVLFDIDWQGTKQIRATAAQDLVSVFILPPSMEELERRLKSRAQDSDEVVQQRMSKARDEISHWEEYDYVIINKDVDEALERITRILRAERLRRRRQPGLNDFVASLCHTP